MCVRVVLKWYAQTHVRPLNRTATLPETHFQSSLSTCGFGKSSRHESAHTHSHHKAQMLPFLIKIALTYKKEKGKMYIRSHATKLVFVWWASGCADAVFEVEAFWFQTLSRLPDGIYENRKNHPVFRLMGPHLTVLDFGSRWAHVMSHIPHHLLLSRNILKTLNIFSDGHLTFLWWHSKKYARRFLHLFHFFLYRASAVPPTVMILRRYSIRIRRRPSQEWEWYATWPSV